MAKAVGVSHATVARIWEAHGLQPHRIETFKLSKDKHYIHAFIFISYRRAHPG